jgi:Na+-translocating ferredoxin:NAD+ oxidoreductase RnfD subunit
LIVPINKQKKESFGKPIQEVAEIFKKVIFLLALMYVVFNTFLSIALGVKAASIILVSVFVAKEVEILFYRYYKKATRDEVKEAIKTTKPEITGIFIALILPIGTPLTVVAIASAFSILIGKLAFGGYTYNIFNPAIVGLIFTLEAFPRMVNNSLGFGVFDKMLINIFGYDSSIYTYGFFQMSNFVLTSTILIIAFVYLKYKKAIDVIIPLTIISSILLMIVTMSIVAGYNIFYTFEAVVRGYMLFAILFMATDPVTAPNNTKGKVIYGVIIATSAVFISVRNTDAQGIFVAILFGNMLTPLIVSKTKDSLKIAASIIVSLVIVIITSSIFATNFL